jgi:hypothetical protein
VALREDPVAWATRLLGMPTASRIDDIGVDEFRALVERHSPDALAAMLGTSGRTIRRRMERYGIEVPRVGGGPGKWAA